jgi:hypothetical protein
MDHESKSVHIAYVRASMLRGLSHACGRWIRDDPTREIDNSQSMTQYLAIVCPSQTCTTL